ncbi:MAG: spondin domain-containing protein [Candidatus Thiodiazotropha sp. (ex Myrtea spinifera)]|nr:spondin domain-containing protein [Candidatus Thiodiazotropha sp. (ex Myrtea spinifera)]MCU7829184.1 spondin domain-containing protein [Candidatus Thiodiazotropha sp. (ex Myrtea sp. 'scaly one' KF741663)]
MKKTLLALVLSGGLLASSSLLAQEVSIKITNLTNATYFTPLLIAAHNKRTHLFQLGTEASAHLQAMAEGGDTSGLISDVEAAGGQYVDNPAGGLLPPSGVAEAVIDVHGRHSRFLSVAAMLLPTNDGFVGLDGLRIPKKRGTYTYYLRGYDAGTEANDEIITGGGMPNTPGIPADPGGNAGVGGVSTVGPDHNPTVHIHRGVIGDDDPAGGPSDLDARVHTWQGPVAKLVIRITERDDDDYDD